MKTLKYALLAVATFAATGIQAEGFGSVGVEVTAVIGTQLCLEKNATCNQNIEAKTTYALGEDLHRINPEQLEDLIKLGDLTEARMLTIDLPDQENDYRVYSMTPKEGPLAGKRLYLAFARLKKPGLGQPMGAFANPEGGTFDAIVEVLRLEEGQNPETDWIRTAVLQMNKLEPTAAKIKATLTKAGDLVDDQGRRLPTGAAAA